MFNLIRRISGSVLLRPDRPWKDDATSNAPQIGRKRRASSPEREDERSTKKARAGSIITVDDSSQREESPAEVVSPAKETADVKEMTKGVKEVYLSEKDAESTASSSPEPSSVDAPPTEIKGVQGAKGEKVVKKLGEAAKEGSSTELAEDVKDAAAPLKEDTAVSAAGAASVQEESDEETTAEESITDHAPSNNAESTNAAVSLEVTEDGATEAISVEGEGDAVKDQDE